MPAKVLFVRGKNNSLKVIFSGKPLGSVISEISRAQFTFHVLESGAELHLKMVNDTYAHIQAILA